jgi:PTS system sucrose-specific IIC component
MSKVLLNGLGIFFIYNTVKYLGGNPLFAIGVGIILLSRGLFADVNQATE